MKTILYCGLLSLVAAESACTFSDYAAEQGKVKEILYIIFSDKVSSWNVVSSVLLHKTTIFNLVKTVNVSQLQATQKDHVPIQVLEHQLYTVLWWTQMVQMQAFLEIT